MVVARYNISQDNEGLLSFLWPDRRILRQGDRPLFLDTAEKLIVYSNAKVESYPGHDTIVVSQVDSERLDTVECLLKLLQGRVRLRQEFLGYLVSLDWQEFLEQFKIVWVTKTTPDWYVEGQTGTVFDLFKVLFEDFSISYPVYRSMQKSHYAVNSALMTMMIRAMEDRQLGISVAYWKAIQRNKPYLPYYKGRILDYVDTGMKENDFISLLFELSVARR
jgi:hypothetical protein